ncbi:Archaeal serine protease [Archaeoglobus sulfaticallidus PM70-1]|uniref:Archaeal serine protease n=1 Tax=Archaeoglobus sulfaticallidus PM70-1 TaxID=387631 RepID=N0BL57_9EURY|nr:S16 family serine protease [Archaeoglobus sulfaticallidus]AGK61276.1 Archaeal serine protease [Archaeoglobus sulfaticallidus PM70-1]
MRFKILLISVMLLLLIPLAEGEFVNAKEVTIKAVAVKSTQPPEGAVINISVIVTSGKGRVFVSTIPYTQIDMQGSAQLAALTACDLLGLDFTKYDFFFTIKADSPIVGGPSAGGVMTVAVISALKDLKIENDVYMTGMIYPDGFIGPVGGIPYKMKAAADMGAKIFLIPKGQRIVKVQETVEERKGPLIVVRTQTKDLDLYEYGKELGVKVVEVETVQEALAYFTGYTISKPKGKVNLFKYSELLKKLADRMEKDTRNLYQTVESYGVRNSPDELNRAKQLMEMAEESYGNGDYYTATSKYFQAKIELRKIYYEMVIRDESDLEREINDIGKEINATKSYLLSQEDIGIESLQIFGAAQERVTLAENYLYLARTSENRMIYYLALSKERVESAKVWLSLLETIKEDIPLNLDDVKRRAELYLSQAQSIAVYANQIGGYQSLIDGAEDDMDSARKQLEEGFYAGAAVSAMNGMVKASLSIELIGADKSSIDSKINSARKASEQAISEAEEYLTPVLSVAYYEFAKTMKNDTLENKILKLSYFKLSERLAKWMLSLSRYYPESNVVKVEYNLEELNNYSEPAASPTVPKLPTSNDVEKIIEGIEAIPSFTAVMFVVAVVISATYMTYKRK